MVYLPVSRHAREGAQDGEAVYQRLNTVPCDASRSMLGVSQSLRPLNPTSAYPRSSASRMTKLGVADWAHPRDGTLAAPANSRSASRLDSIDENYSTHQLQSGF